jgi:hypothetical protein
MHSLPPPSKVELTSHWFPRRLVKQSLGAAPAEKKGAKKASALRQQRNERKHPNRKTPQKRFFMARNYLMLACTDTVGIDGIVTVAGLFHSAVKQYVTNATHMTISVSSMLWRCGMRGARCEDVGCGIAFDKSKR